MVMIDLKTWKPVYQPPDHNDLVMTLMDGDNGYACYVEGDWYDSDQDNGNLIEEDDYNYPIYWHEIPETPCLF